MKQQMYANVPFEKERVIGDEEKDRLHVHLHSEYGVSSYDVQWLKKIFT